MASKRIYETDAVKAFAARMSAASIRKYRTARDRLALRGYLLYPEAEKVEGYADLFAIRILTAGNERFFYCYDRGDLVVIFHAFTKTTRKTPQSELKKALRIKRELLGGAK